MGDEGPTERNIACGNSSCLTPSRSSAPKSSRPPSGNCATTSSKTMKAGPILGTFEVTSFPKPILIGAAGNILATDKLHGDHIMETVGKALGE